MIYLDNAATTVRKPPAVAEAVLSALGSFGNSGRGAYGEALDAGRCIYETRLLLGELFHCPAEAMCTAYLYAVAEEGGAFLDVVVKGEADGIDDT